jgi:hypothetical protein
MSGPGQYADEEFASPAQRQSMQLVAAGLLVLQAVLLAWNAWCHSPVATELSYLPAGLSHVQLGRFDLVRVNPPLVRTVAALPVSLASPATDWTHYDANPLRRAEGNVGSDFLRANGIRVFRLYAMARWSCIPFALLGGYVCLRWASRLYGDLSGLLALVLWCVSPSVLAYGSLMTPDLHAAALGIWACYAFWLWLQQPSMSRAFLAGTALGLTALAKFTFIVFYPLWPVMWGLYHTNKASEGRVWRWGSELSALLLLLMTSVLIINVGYGFEGSFQRLADYRFQTRILTGADSLESIPPDGGNRFADSWLGTLRVPVPKNYLQGIDTQKLDFEQKKWSYLRGEWKMGGWWYYYLYTLAIKVPLGTCAVFVLGVLACFGRGYLVAWRDELFLLLPAFTIFALVSSQTGFSIHSYYVLPVLPFAFVWCSKVMRCVELRQWTTAYVVVAAVCWSTGSSLWLYPHSLSYFNELTAGPKNGHAHLLGSQIAWGQDLLYLVRWLDAHPDAPPMQLASHSGLDLRPLRPGSQIQAFSNPGEASCLAPGWYAVDVNKLRSRTKKYAYFLRFRPVAMAGYSIYIYHITPDEANRVRRELGLRELPEDWERGHEQR